MKQERGKIVRVGTAGWTIPRAAKAHFPQSGSHLERYAQVFNCVEINSSFYNEHKPETFARWRESVPEDFAFSLKLNQLFTHRGKLLTDSRMLKRVLHAYSELGSKWQALLVQLPGKLEFGEKQADKFFSALRARYSGAIFCEPRNASWGKLAAQKVFRGYKVNRVMADPERCPWPKSLKTQAATYLRLHGAPVLYRSSYAPESIAEFTRQMLARSKTGAWCIFDNTTFGHAVENALRMKGDVEDVL